MLTRTSRGLFGGEQKGPERKCGLSGPNCGGRSPRAPSVARC